MIVDLAIVVAVTPSRRVYDAHHILRLTLYEVEILLVKLVSQVHPTAHVHLHCSSL
jgi:hypothetical protein